MYTKCFRSDDFKIQMQTTMEKWRYVEMVTCVVLHHYRMVRNISRGEEGRVLPEDLHRILGETC